MMKKQRYLRWSKPHCGKRKSTCGTLSAIHYTIRKIFRSRLRTFLMHLPHFGKRLNGKAPSGRSEEHTSELQSLMRISYAVFCLKNKHNITLLYSIPPTPRQEMH